ncbi:MAG: IS1380 family transposase, partial [Cycloclasticus sp.]
FATTNEKLTSRAGLLIIAELMKSINLADTIDQSFPQPKGNRGFKPSLFLQTFILMHHEGSFHLDDVRHLSDDDALRIVLNLKHLPQACTLGNWLRKMGNDPDILKFWTLVNKPVLKAALHKCKGITLDIDASEIISGKLDAQWTYKKNKGYMPMVGHIAETGQIVSCDFREGNAAPAKENFEFIQQCQQALPSDCFLKALRIDCAGYQTKIIQHCDEKNITYAIRALMTKSMRVHFNTLNPEVWQDLIDKNGEPVENQQTYRTSHCIGNYEKAFTLIVQRTKIIGQVEIDLEGDSSADDMSLNGYVYRAIATNHDSKTNSEVIHWYNQRAEDSENRIKELKLDFGGNTLPCSDFKANALYFLICSLSYNLFALMRQLLPENLAHHRVITIRWRLYAIAAKIVKTGRQLFVKLKSDHQKLLGQVLDELRRFKPIGD